MHNLDRDYDIYPYKINIKNSIRLRDVGAWADFEDVANEVLKIGVISEDEYLESEKFARTQGLRGDEHKVLRNILKLKGYDGIVYKNDSEDKGNDSFIVFDKSNIHEVTTLDLYKIYQKSKNTGNNSNLVKEVEGIIKNHLKENSIREIVREILKESFAEFSSFNLSDDELRRIAEWGLTGDYSTSGCWDDNEDNIEDAINCAVGDFNRFLKTPYPIELGKFPNNPIIYRFIRLKTINDLKSDNLGYSWFSNPEQYKIPGFFDMLDYLKPWKTENGETYLIKAQTSIDNVDIQNTLWQRSTQWQENEIVVKDGSSYKIKILSIKKASELR